MSTRFDATPVLDRLKDFQRRTVDYVFRRMYTGPEPTTRFLVADEVGLGKTMVAKGLIAKVVGSPYLEVHHRQLLAEGGADTIENAIALCPNCHRERHYGASGLNG